MTWPALTLREQAMKYVLIIERGDDVYWGYFPDLPGCATAADSLDEIEGQASDALSLHLESETEVLPARSLEEVLADPEVREILDGSEIFATVEYDGGRLASA